MLRLWRRTPTVDFSDLGPQQHICSKTVSFGVYASFRTQDLAGGGGVWVRDCLSRLGVSFRLMPGRSVNCLWCSSPRCLGEGCFFGFSQGGLVGLFVKACDEISSHLRVLVGGPRQRGPSSPSFVSSVSQLCFFGGISPTCTSQFLGKKRRRFRLFACQRSSSHPSVTAHFGTEFPRDTTATPHPVLLCLGGLVSGLSAIRIGAPQVCLLDPPPYHFLASETTIGQH
ncbi:hypothetical protein F2Q68_00009831 [Brassica cretica]|uniref:Uncharacterized protein n=1 Tax=Brassica cretica TaxID=69181 RepID=A0A3N6T2V8_BRACR|nr:hypothetical protein F2Q68_00009831 [Brassica cretica]